jgi:hypothetical protein
MQRTALLLALSVIYGFAQTPARPTPAESAVTAAYKQLEKAARDGDPDLWLSLHNQATRAQTDEATLNGMRASAKRRGPNPSVRYSLSAVRVLGSRAAVIGSITGLRAGSTEVSYHSLRYVLESGEWKIADETVTDTPPDRRSIYALAPPESGAFLRANSPWATVAYADLNSARFKPEQLPWKMQATQDDAFLYIRFEAAMPLPATGLEIQKTADLPEPPGTVKILTSTGPGFEFQLGPVMQTKATYNEATKKYDNRYFVQYSLAVRNATRGVQTGDDIFHASTDDQFGNLVTANGRFLEIRIPLAALGLNPALHPVIRLEEFNSLPKILPYRVIVRG